eukprot:3186430-Pleurochrysis_carterae.AAC.3
MGEPMMEDWRCQLSSRRNNIASSRSSHHCNLRQACSASSCGNVGTATLVLSGFDPIVCGAETGVESGRYQEYIYRNGCLRITEAYILVRGAITIHAIPFNSSQGETIYLILPYNYS